MQTAVLFAISLLVVVGGSELFTNAVEWAGYRLGLGRGATGSLLAALGTALPETVVPIVALLGRHPDSENVAIGAVVGAPFLLLSLGMAVTGVAVWARRRRPVLDGDAAQVRRDLGTFLAGAALLGVAMVLPLGGRIVVGILLLVLYGRHIRATLAAAAAGSDLPEPLHLVRLGAKGGETGPVPIVVQLVLAVVLLVAGADLFVRALDDLAGTVHIGALVLAVVLVPVATELPECLNSVLWVGSDDDTLALGNVAGATAFQACIPGFIGVVFTAWRPGAAGVLNGALSIVTALALLAALRDGRIAGWRLALAALPWLIFVATVLVAGQRLTGG